MTDSPNNNDFHNIANELRKVSNQLGSLQNTIQKSTLDMQRTFIDSNSRYKEQVWGGTERYLTEIPNAIKDAVKAAGVGTYKQKRNGHQVGDLTEKTSKKLDREIQRRIDTISEIEEKLSYMDQPNIPWHQTKEGMEVLQEIIQTLNVSMDDANKVLQPFNQTMGDVSNAMLDLSKCIKVVEEGSDRFYERIDTVFSQVRDDVVALHNSIVDTENTVKATNDIIADLAAKSDSVSLMLDNFSNSIGNVNTANELFANAVLNQAVSVEQRTNQINRNLIGFSTAIGNMQNVVNRFTTTTVGAIQKIQNASQGSSGGSSFREQATRNSDRAKQAGFLALLIPALAHLLRKNNIFTDILRYLMLRFGGKHPVAATVGLMASPLIASAIVSKVLMNKALWNGVGKFAGNLPKGLTGPKGGIIPWNQIGKYASGYRMGLTIPRGYSWEQLTKWHAGQPDPIKRYKKIVGTDALGNRKVTFAKNAAGERLLEDVPNKVMQNRGYNDARNLMSNFTRQVSGTPKWLQNLTSGMTNSKLAQSITNLKIPVGVAKFGRVAGRLATPLAAMGMAWDDVKEGKFGEASRKEGLGGIVKQTGKTAIGAGAGVAGMLQGAGAGAGIGMAIGALTGPFAVVMSPLLGAIGGLVGALAGGKIFKGLADILTGNANKNAKKMADQWKEQHNVQNAFYAGVVDRVAMIFECLSPIGECIKGIWEWIKEKFHIGDKKDDKSGEGSGGKSNDTINGMKKELESDKYKIGTKENNALWDKYRKEYAEKTADDYALKKIKEEHPDVKVDNKKFDKLKEQYKKDYMKAAVKSDEAQEYAAKAIKKEQDDLRTKIGNKEKAIGSTLPANAKISELNGVDVVAMKDLGLKGSISADNSKPYIAAENAQKLKALDTLLSSTGKKYDYTSAMGGKHHGSSKKSHAGGGKVDIATRGAVFTPEEYERMYREGYFGGNTGALGYEYKKGQKHVTTPEQYKKMYDAGQVRMGNNNHYDLSVASGVGLTEAQKAAYNSQPKTQTQTATVTGTATNTTTTASSEIRDGLAAIVGSKAKNAKQERARNIIFNSAVDVTGSLGVWGITQLNNGVMNVGK